MELLDFDKEFTLVSFRTMKPNLGRSKTKRQIIDDLTLKYDRDNIFDGPLDRIMATWIVYKNLPCHLFKIVELKEDNLLIEKISSSDEAMTRIKHIVDAIRHLDSRTNYKSSCNNFYPYAFYSYQYTPPPHEPSFLKKLFMNWL